MGKMLRVGTKSDQIHNGGVLRDYDEIFQPIDSFQAALPKSARMELRGESYLLRLNNKVLSVCLRRVTYLGRPHPKYKKRIQLPQTWKKLLKKRNLLLIGVYKYRKTTIFIGFNGADYRNNIVNNSSVHVHAIDIQKALEFGSFSKIDNKGNKIVAFKPELLQEYLAGTLKFVPKNIEQEVRSISRFAYKIPRVWDGRDCYLEMFLNKFSKKGEAEWPGFYLEYLFNSHLNSSPREFKICRYIQDKRRRRLDFDLKFARGFHGDLKCHSEHSKAILGNDKRNVDETLRQHRKLWYIVFTHATQMDFRHGGWVTKLWNVLQKKKNLRSYASKMKALVRHKKMMILEINKLNRRYLVTFRQGAQKNGAKRKIKVKIPSKAIDNFIIHQQLL